MPYQYTSPARPAGSNAAVWRMRAPAPSGATSNSSHARPGSRISPTRRRKRSASKASTRQQSTVSPTASRSGWRRPRRMPAPPARRSRKPRSLHSQSFPYQPEAPPIRRTGAKARDVGTGTRSARESTRRRPIRMPPNGDGAAPETERASDQRVSANSRSSFSRARAIAVRMSLGTHREHAPRRGVAHHRRVSDAVDQLAPDAGVERSHEAEPEAAEPRRQHRHRQQPASQAALSRVLAHQVRVGHPIGAPDLVDGAPGRVFVQRRQQIARGGRRSRSAAPASRSSAAAPAAGGAPPARGSSRRRGFPSRSRSTRAARSRGRRPRAAGARPRRGSADARRGAGSRPRARRGRRCGARPRRGRPLRTGSRRGDPPPRSRRSSPWNGSGRRRSRRRAGPRASQPPRRRRPARPRCPERRARRGAQDSGPGSGPVVPAPRGLAAGGRPRSRSRR